MDADKMTKRDPRDDPQVGDIVHTGHGIVCLITGRDGDRVLWCFGLFEGGGTQGSGECTLATWQRYAARLQVLQVAEWSIEAPDAVIGL
jgi:hypothetical protein